MTRPPPDASGLPSSIRGLSRRDFLRLCGGAAGAFGLSLSPFAHRVARALEPGAGRPPVVWLEGQDCAGCTVAFAGLRDPPTARILLENISLRYHETLGVATGHQAEQALRQTVSEGGHVLVVEGSIPGADPRFCTVGGRPFRQVVLEAAEGAAAIVALGACAAFGGIPAATPSRGQPVSAVLPHRTVVKIPTCPGHPEQFLEALLHLLGQGEPPPLDAHGRPRAFFSRTVHQDCPRRPHFDAGRFLEDPTDPAQRDGCLLARGCKGPWSWSDCSRRLWNHGVNTCTRCGGGCQACGEPEFYAGVAPLYFPGAPEGREPIAVPPPDDQTREDPAPDTVEDAP